MRKWCKERGIKVRKKRRRSEVVAVKHHCCSGLCRYTGAVEQKVVRKVAVVGQKERKEMGSQACEELQKEH